jgi:acetylornithine deacetylase/succinyl-diaminopimelate desuccinylase-like protein
MAGTRDGAVARARETFESGAYVRALEALVAVRTESQNPERGAELRRYCADVLGPMVESLGCAVQVLDNPLPERGPILVGRRIEDAQLPTVLVYGHGDVVHGMAERGLDPFRITVEGERLYGRGTADNKGQHLIALESLRAVLAERGSLGFNVTFLVETGEEVGSPGLRAFLQHHRDLCAADVFIGLDGPRKNKAIPELSLGARGGLTFDLVLNLRAGSHHSGHWGGVLADPGFVMAHALASIVSKDGRILVPGWRPENVPESVRRACATVEFEESPDLPQADPSWGEPGMSKAERIFAWTSVIVLASVTGEPRAPTNAVAGFAKARLQVRHTVDLKADEIIPNLRRHLDANGFEAIEIVPVTDQDPFAASRTDPDNPWVRLVVESMTRTAGRGPNVVPNGAGSNPSEIFKQELGVPIMWLPQSYAGCGQHGPDEHALAPLYRDGLGLMAGVWWDIGEHGAAARKGSSGGA